MSVMTRFTARTLKSNRVRTVASILGIALSCALIMAIFTSVTSVQAAMHARTLKSEGSYHAYISNLPTEAFTALEQSEHVSDLAVSRELGSGRLADEDTSTAAAFVSVRTLPQAIKGSLEPGGISITPLPDVVEGRAPEAAGEIMLPYYSKGDAFGANNEDASVASAEPLVVGSTLTLDLGTRKALTAQGQTVTLDVTNPLHTPKNGFNPTEEWLEDTTRKTYNVTGFYELERLNYGSGLNASPSSLIALASPSEPGQGLRATYLTTKGFPSVESLSSFVYEHMGSNQITPRFHNNLLMYEFPSLDGLLRNSLWPIALVLALVIVITSTSLVYNSFAISISERIRQFGLLSSIGASKKQLRHSVLFEALILGIMGIPLGILFGAAGTVAVFAATHTSLASQLRVEALPLIIDPAAIACAAALAFLAVLLSAWVPAWRAGKITAIDTIKNSREVRLTKHTQRKACRAQPLDTRQSLVKAFRRGVSGKLFGAPGYIAHRNLSRSTGRGRIVAVSLTMSVVLIVAAGSAILYLKPIADQSARLAEHADIVVRGIAHTSESGNNQSTYLDEFKNAAAQGTGINLVASFKEGRSQAVIPAAMLSPDMRTFLENEKSKFAENDTPFDLKANGDALRMASLYYIDQASWSELLQQLNINESDLDPSAPYAIALNDYQSHLSDQSFTKEEMYSGKPFASTGNIDLYTTNSILSADTHTFGSFGLKESKDENLVVRYRAQHDSEESSFGTTIDVPISEADKTTVEVIGLAENEPIISTLNYATHNYPSFILLDPTSATPAFKDAYNALPVASVNSENIDHTDLDPKVTFINPYGLYAYSGGNFFFKADNHEAAAQQLETLAQDTRSVNYQVDNLTGASQRYTSTTQSLQIFVTCFTATTLLIAIASVFTTLSSTIMLRGREFAVLKSCGMGEHEFAHMLAYECASYAARGLVGGLVAAVVIPFAIYKAISTASPGVEFAWPWLSILLAIVLVLLVLAISIVFALHRSRTSNIVDTLRMDAS